ncbi:MAG TPA: glycoside hydrolase family 3 C-terminal domain-containing protein, partial [Opitutales bacterium]|nr:glycoside hydrolase family 3 C-terminal domain-containing protein [Opitutales bacterium]
GLQGDNPNTLQAAACAKHFAVHSGPESLRHVFDAKPSAADLHDTYLPAFEALVREGHVEIVMTAYNAIDGTPCSVDPLLYGLLEEWGFDGHVTSDCGSVADLSRTYKRAADDAEAEAMTLNAGMNVRCGDEPVALLEAVRRGLITEDTVNARLRPLLRTMMRLGFFDPADTVPFNSISPSENDSPAHDALALKAAEECIVLLKNDGILPLDSKRVRRVAVIGPNASSVPVLVGNYNGTPSHPVTVLAGLREEFAKAGIETDYAYGCDYAWRPEAWVPIPQPWFRGEYFSNPDLSGTPAEIQWDRPICFECHADKTDGRGLPRGLPKSGVSIRWQGAVPTTVAGEYGLRVRARGGFRLYVDGALVIDSWTAPSGSEDAVREVATTRILPENASVPFRLEYAQGAGPVSLALEWKTPAPDSGIAQALALADKADAIVYVGGLTAQLEGEEMQVDYVGFSGGDRDTIELPRLQEQLLEKLFATGKPVVVVNLSGSAVALTQADARANAVVQAWYPGQQGGRAVAEILTGAVNPSGRLPVTFYRATEDLPAFTDYDMEGRTYKYFKGSPLYPFGHGLSYTKFDTSNLRVASVGDGTLAVSVDVANVGMRDGDEVVQLYAVPPAASHPRESQSLCGFARASLKAGEKTTLHLVIPATALRRWDDEKNDYAVPQGEWTIRAGASSADIRQSAHISL